jgi:hypothetical protein
MVRRKPKGTIELNQDEVLTFLGGAPRAASRRMIDLIPTRRFFPHASLSRSSFTTESHARSFHRLLPCQYRQKGKSGLGLESQRKAVLDYLDGGNWELLTKFTEVESDEQPPSGAREGDRALVIAKLDQPEDCREVEAA